MDLILINLLQAPILFFVVGIIAAALKSDLEIPGMKGIGIYLLAAIGLHGGVALASTGVTRETSSVLVAAMVLALSTPLVAYWFLKQFLAKITAAATAAAYGSVSAVTFMAACAFLDRTEQDYSGHMIAALALMEWPAIVIGLWLARRGHKQDKSTSLLSSLSCGSVIVLIAGLLIGISMGDKEWSRMQPFFHELFPGVLCLFLLGLGIEVGKRVPELKKVGWRLLVFGLSFPIVLSIAALAVAQFLDLSRGDALLLMVLSASASYIAVPAAMKVSLPEADSSVYLTAALAITFPFNIVLGIPSYAFLTKFI